MVGRGPYPRLAGYEPPRIRGRLRQHIWYMVERMNLRIFYPLLKKMCVSLRRSQSVIHILEKMRSMHGTVEQYNAVTNPATMTSHNSYTERVIALIIILPVLCSNMRAIRSFATTKKYPNHALLGLWQGKSGYCILRLYYNTTHSNYFASLGNYYSLYAHVLILNTVFWIAIES